MNTWKVMIVNVLLNSNVPLDPVHLVNVILNNNVLHEFVFLDNVTLEHVHLDNATRGSVILDSVILNSAPRDNVIRNKYVYLFYVHRLAATLARYTNLTLNNAIPNKVHLSSAILVNALLVEKNNSKLLRPAFFAGLLSSQA